MIAMEMEADGNGRVSSDFHSNHKSLLLNDLCGKEARKEEDGGNGNRPYRGRFLRFLPSHP